MQVYVPGPPRLPAELRSGEGAREVYGIAVAKQQPPVTQLRDAADAPQSLVEATTVYRAALDGMLPMPRAAAFFESLRVVHSGLEVAIASSTLHSLRGPFNAGLEQAKRFERDLDRMPTVRLSERSKTETRTIAARLELLGRRDAVALLGPLYALSRLSLSYPVMRRRVSTKLGAPIDEDGENASRVAWVAFLDHLDGLVLTDASLDRACRACNDTLVGLLRVCASLG